MNMGICNNCMNFPCTDEMSVMLKSCPAYNPIPKPETNGDRIRYEITDAELVKMMRCPYSRCIDLDKECNACMLEWLKSPAEKE